MERVLDIYKRPYDAQHPVVCFDESSKQQIQEVVDGLPARPGSPRKFDSEYKRTGVSNLFMFFEPLTGWRHVKVTDKRKAVDWAYCMRDLVDIHCHNVEKITVVMDNLNTHTPASLYKTFSPEEAK